MKLVKARVTNYRSVEDSGEFTIDEQLCLVGKNEAGKTAILQAISGLNPHPSTPIEYDRERDYPRRHFSSYAQRHPDGEAVVVRTWWLPDAADIERVEKRLGPRCLTKNSPIEIYRRYGDKGTSWLIPVDEYASVSFFIQSAALDEDEVAPLVSESLEALQQSLERLEAPTQKQAALLTWVRAVPAGNLAQAAKSLLEEGFPRFMYFSHYDRMSGDMRVDDVNGANGTRSHAGGAALQVGEFLFLEFLEFAGTSIEEIRTSTTYESLNARCEAASNAITDQLRDYWTQNPYLDIEIRLTKAESGDSAPLNVGVIARARVKNTLHRVTVPFSERSAGFIWFFSFLVKFSQVQKLGGPVLLMLDEPGLTLHGKAQADLLRYFAEKIVPSHQLIYSTHSPFMVPADDLAKSRIVEDQIIMTRPNAMPTTAGTKVRDDILATDPDTLFPLQGALGYDVTQTLFVGRNTLLVEGPSDILYLKALSEQLRRRKRTALDKRWTLCPAGGIDKIQSFVALFAGANLEMAVLTDFAVSDKRKLEALRKSPVVKAGRVMTFAELLDMPEADIEDIFDPDTYLSVVNSAYGLTKAQKLTPAKLEDAAPHSSRLVKRVEAAHRLLPAEIDEFDHFTPADWLIRNPSALEGVSPDVERTLERAEKVIRAINDKLAAV